MFEYPQRLDSCGIIKPQKQPREVGIQPREVGIQPQEVGILPKRVFLEILQNLQAYGI